jgi:hypothetical protein
MATGDEDCILVERLVKYISEIRNFALLFQRNTRYVPYTYLR